MRRVGFLARLTTIALVLTGCDSDALTAQSRFAWEPIGPGGGGTLTAPAVSPHDPNLLFAGCDMSGVYRSTDGGASWRMIPSDQLRSAVGMGYSSWAFAPDDPHLILVGASGGLRRSTDAGETWQPVDGPWDGAPAVIEFGRAGQVAACLNRGPAVYLSDDRGATWHAAPPLPEDAGRVLGATFDHAGALIVGCQRGLFVLAGGWTRNAVDQGELIDFEGACDGTRTVLWATTPTRDEGGRLAGGVWRSMDRGQTWTSAMNGLDERLGRRDQWSPELPRYEHLAAGDADPDVAYVASVGTVILGDHPSTVYRTDDAGEHWTPMLYGDPRMPGHNTNPDWLTIEQRWGWADQAVCLRASDGDPLTLLRSDNGRLMLSRDGGARWTHLHSPEPRGRAVPNGTLTVTTSWQVVFDPHETNRLYLCDTDIGLWRSLDGGETWLYSTRGSPWTNTFYALVCDPDRPGRLYAAVSRTHDIPYWQYVTSDARQFGGGVVVSDDWGESWRPLGQGSLPDGAVIDLWLDQRPRRLWAAVMGHGVYRSHNDGASWQACNRGLELERNENLIRVRRDPHGRLLALVTMRYYRETRDLRDGGLFASDDDGASWRRLNTGTPLHHPVEFAVDPRDGKVIYVACMEAPAGRAGGGLWKSIDGGTTFRRIHRAGGDGASFAPILHPADPDLVYHATAGDGLWVSGDGGGSWRRLGLPFGLIHRVQFNPREPNRLYVTTFGGGAWRGTELP